MFQLIKIASWADIVLITVAAIARGSGLVPLGAHCIHNHPSSIFPKMMMTMCSSWSRCMEPVGFGNLTVFSILQWESTISQKSILGVQLQCPSDLQSCILDALASLESIMMVIDRSSTVTEVSGTDRVRILALYFLSIGYLASQDTLEVMLVSKWWFSWLDCFDSGEWGPTQDIPWFPWPQCTMGKFQWEV